jgi:hypothetical protein
MVQGTAFETTVITMVHFAMSRMERAGICMPLTVASGAGCIRFQVVAYYIWLEQ